MKTKTRHNKYKIGTCKLTVTVENEDRIRVHNRAMARGFADDSSFLRSVIHEAVWDEPLTKEDLEKLEDMRKEQAK